MAEIKAFGNLQIAHTNEDVRNIELLLGNSSPNNLICDECGGTMFKVRVIKESDIILSSRDHILLYEETNARISAIKIIGCAVCNNKDIVLESYAKT